MSAGDDTDLAATAWPGFVDILSSVLIMFVFFLMITAVAFNFYTLLFKAKVKSDAVESAKIEVTNEHAQLNAENERLRQELVKANKGQAANDKAMRALEARVKLLQDAAQMADSVEQSYKILPGNTAIYVFYGADAISLTDETSKVLTDFVKNNAANPHITIEAAYDQSTGVDQAARRVALARMLNARNVPLHEGRPASAIKARIVPAKEVDGHTDWVRITMGAK